MKCARRACGGSRTEGRREEQLRIVLALAACAVWAWPGLAASALPDLKISAVSGPSAAGQGSAIDVSDTVVAAGSAVGTFTVGYYLSADATITTADEPLGTRTVAKLARNASSSATTRLALPAAAVGVRYLGVIADPARLVAESNEANNAGVPVKVTIAADTTPPVITVQGVTEGQVSGAQQLTACVVVTDASPTTVTATLDGAALVGGCGTATTEGDHLLAVQAVDVAGNVADATIHFALDHTPPSLVVESPAEGQVLAATPAAVSVRATDAHAIAAVSVNGFAATLQGDGTWRAEVDLAEGPNLLAVAGSDVAGNGASTQVGVVLDTMAPALAIAAPAEGAVVAEVATVTGSVSDATAVTVNVNGVPAPVAGDGTWSAGVTLQPGPQTLTAAAVDAAGNVTTVMRGVSVPYPAPGVTITEPTPGFAASAEAVEVRGSVAGNAPISVTVAGLTVATVAVAADAERSQGRLRL